MPKSEKNTRPYNKPEKRKAKQNVKDKRRRRKLEKEQGMSGKLAVFAGDDLHDSWSSAGKSSQAKRQTRKYMDDHEAKNLRRKRQSGKSRGYSYGPKSTSGQQPKKSK